MKVWYMRFKVYIDILAVNFFFYKNMIYGLKNVDHINCGFLEIKYRTIGAYQHLSFMLSK
jgi:hypothetical protein